MIKLFQNYSVIFFALVLVSSCKNYDVHYNFEHRTTAWILFGYLDSARNVYTLTENDQLYLLDTTLCPGNEAKYWYGKYDYFLSHEDYVNNLSIIDSISHLNYSKEYYKISLDIFQYLDGDQINHYYFTNHNQIKAYYIYLQSLLKKYHHGYYDNKLKIIDN